MTLELYGFGTEPPADESAQTESVLAWQHAQEVFAGSEVHLQYVSIHGELERSFSLRIWDFHTYRVLLGSRAIGRTNANFNSAERLEKWVRQVVAGA